MKVERRAVDWSDSEPGLRPGNVYVELVGGPADPARPCRGSSRPAPTVDRPWRVVAAASGVQLGQRGPSRDRRPATTAPRRAPGPAVSWPTGGAHQRLASALRPAAPGAGSNGSVGRARLRRAELAAGRRTVMVADAPVVDAATGRVRVVSERCATCDFRPGNRRNLAPGQLARLIADCLADEEHIVCHETGDAADAPGAVCAGFAAHPDAGRSSALRGAATGLAELQHPARADSPAAERAEARLLARTAPPDARAPHRRVPARVSHRWRGSLPDHSADARPFPFGWPAERLVGAAVRPWLDALGEHSGLSDESWPRSGRAAIRRQKSAEDLPGSGFRRIAGGCLAGPPADQGAGGQGVVAVVITAAAPAPRGSGGTRRRGRRQAHGGHTCTSTPCTRVDGDGLEAVVRPVGATSIRAGAPPEALSRAVSGAAHGRTHGACRRSGVCGAW
ncbi:hypothetical protein SGLAU_32205 [Streptomyces glaucescens]|uniref:Uncharacterized protein n=1 Tax=Streptomyces glaucescens TaxID=1907 RepID=A0A089XMF8_STRGA|nr:hypothetical protein SGLAU_32205 [Streptomyces glaucescens]